MEPYIGIVIVNYNNYSDTIECINSIFKNNYSNYKIYLIENGSLNESFFNLKSYLGNSKRVNLIHNKYNLGFSGGNNIGIKAALKDGAEYVLLLNNDTIIDQNAIKSLINTFLKNINIGIITGKILYYTSPEYLNLAGGKISYLKGKIILFGEGKKDIKKYNNPSATGFASGCCQLINSDVFRKIGFYDEDYFLYYEDSDFCARTLKAGYGIFYQPQSVIYHKVSKSTGSKINKTTMYYNVRNRLFFIKKNSDNFLCRIVFYIYYSLTYAIKFTTLKKDMKKIYRVAIRDYINNRGGVKDESINDE